MNFIAELASYVRPYSAQLAFAFVASCLILFAGDINNALRTLVKSWNVALRVLVFIMLCAVGYGLVAAWLADLLKDYLRGLSSELLLLHVCVAFVLLGVLIERKNWK